MNALEYRAIVKAATNSASETELGESETSLVPTSEELEEVERWAKQFNI